MLTYDKTFSRRLHPHDGQQNWRKTRNRHNGARIKNPIEIYPGLEGDQAKRNDGNGHPHDTPVLELKQQVPVLPIAAMGCAFVVFLIGEVHRRLRLHVPGTLLALRHVDARAVVLGAVFFTLTFLHVLLDATTQQTVNTFEISPENIHYEI